MDISNPPLLLIHWLQDVALHSQPNELFNTSFLKQTDIHPVVVPPWEWPLRPGCLFFFKVYTFTVVAATSLGLIWGTFFLPFKLFPSKLNFHVPFETCVSTIPALPLRVNLRSDDVSTCCYEQASLLLYSSACWSFSTVHSYESSTFKCVKSPSGSLNFKAEDRD